MPRKLKSRASVGPRAVKRRPRKFKFEWVPLETPELVDIGPDNKLWRQDVPHLEQLVSEGDIVRLTAPPGTAIAKMAAFERACYDLGASSVKALPIQDELKVTVGDEVFEFEEDDDRSLRQVALDRAANAKNSVDPDAVAKAINQAMDFAESKA